MPVVDGPELPSAQVAADLRRRIEADEWQPRQRLPAVPVLAREYQVGHGTVRKALRELAAEKPPLVVIVARWGSFRA